MAAVILALAGAALALGGRLAAVAASLVALAVARGGVVGGVGAAGFCAVVALARHEGRVRRERRAERELARQLLEAVVEAASVEPDVATALQRALAQVDAAALDPVRTSLAKGSTPEAALERGAPTLLRPLASALAFCRRSGTRLAMTAALTRDELVRRWEIEEEAESAIALLRTVTTALAACVLGALALLAVATAFTRLPGAGAVTGFALASSLFALLLPRAWSLL
jgi:hypothetical protein